MEIGDGRSNSPVPRLLSLCVRVGCTVACSSLQLVLAGQKRARSSRDAKKDEAGHGQIRDFSTVIAPGGTNG